MPCAHGAVYRERLADSAHLHGGGQESSPDCCQPAGLGALIHFEHHFARPGRSRMLTQFAVGEAVRTTPLDLRVEATPIST